MSRLVEGAMVIARRDFTATVLSRSFLFFLLAPLFPIAVGLIFGSLTANAARTIEPPAIAVVGGVEDFRYLAEARARLTATLPDTPFITLRRVAPSGDPGQRGELLRSSESPVIAILEGGFEHPRLFGSIDPQGTVASQTALLVDQARMAKSLGGDRRILPLVVARTSEPSQPLGGQRAITAQGAQAILFVLTILLSTMLLSQLIEEKSNKIIEVLAAAVPVSAIFLGKLLAMLAVSFVGIGVWTSAGALAVASLSERGLDILPPPAVGWPIFLIFALLYFAMSYLLLGAIFLGIGGQAATAREVQTLSMPVTMGQVVIFAIAALAVGDPDGPRTLAAAAFPLSSPYVMLARAAERPELWPHFVALAWQILWVAIFVTIAARLFRKSVLKSGPDRSRRRQAKRA